MIKQTAMQPRMAEVGKIKIGYKGAKTKSKNNVEFQPPKKYDHFMVTTTEKGADGNFIIDATLMDKIGSKPRELSIRLLFDDIDMNFHTEFQMYKGKKRVCYGDGETATRTFQTAGKQTIPTPEGDKQVTVKADESVPIKCDPKTCPFAQPDAKGKTLCKVSGILSCMITDTMELGGVYRFRTHSWNSVSSILAALQFFADNTKGILQGLPLKLKMIKKTTEEHGQIDYVTIVLDGMKMLDMRQAALTEFQNRNLLGIEMKKIESDAIQSGFLIDTDDPKDIADEYYPDETEPLDITPKKGVSSTDITEKLEQKKKQTETPVIKAEPTPKTDDGSLF